VAAGHAQAEAADQARQVFLPAGQRLRGQEQAHGGGIGAEAGGGAIGASGGGGEGTQDGSEGIIEDELHSTRPPEGMYPTSHDNEQYSPAEMVTWLQVVAWAITGVVQGGGVLGEQEGTG